MLLKHKNAALLETQESLSIENSSLQEEIKNKGNRISIQNEEKVQLQKALSKVQEEASTSLKKIEELQIIIDKNETINTRNIVKIGGFKTENERLKMELERKCEEVEQANAMIGELTQTKDSLMATINALQSEKDMFRSQMDSLQTNYDNLKSEYENLRKSDNRQPFGGEIEVEVSPNANKRQSKESNKSSTNINGNEDVDADSNVDIVVRGIDIDKGVVQQNEKIGSSLELIHNGSDSISKINHTFSDEVPTDCDVNDASIIGDGTHDIENMEQSSDAALEHSKKHLETLIEDSTEVKIKRDNSNIIVEVDGQSGIKSVSVDDTLEEDDVLYDDTLPYIYDYGLIPAEKLSIPEVYDVKEGKSIKAREFFSQKENELILWRRNLQEEYLTGRARFICSECKRL